MFTIICILIGLIAIFCVLAISGRAKNRESSVGELGKLTEQLEQEMASPVRDHSMIRNLNQRIADLGDIS